MTTVKDKKVHPSEIWIDGKRINSMREISKATFEDSFLYIEVNTQQGIFIVLVDDSVDCDKYDKFVEKYKLCKVKILREVSREEIRKQKNK